MPFALDIYAALAGGPCEILYATSTLWSKGDVPFQPEPVYKGNETSVYGETDPTLEDLIVKVPVQLAPLYESLAVLIPPFYRAPVRYSRLISAAANVKTIDVFGMNGDLYHGFNACVPKPPELTLGADADPFGTVEINLLCAPTLQLGDTNSFWTLTPGASNPGCASYSNSNLLKCRWTATFEPGDGSGGYLTSQAGFFGSGTFFEPADHFTVTPTPTLTPIKVQGLTRDFRLEKMQWSVKVRPLGPTLAQIDTLLNLCSFKQGARIPGGRLTLTSAVGSHSLIFTNMVPKKYSAVYGGQVRNGEIVFESALSVVSGTQNPLLVIS